VDLDHMEFLGDTREKIGFEKAGIYRSGKMAICGDENPPDSLVDFATEIGANFQLINRDFSLKEVANGLEYNTKQDCLALPALSLLGSFQLNNAACAIRAVQHLNTIMPVSEAGIGDALKAVTLIGRFYQTQQSPTIIVDVAHNPQAAKSLAHNLQSIPCAGRTLAVFAMLADKDIEGVIGAVLPHISVWYLADIHNIRGAKAQDLQHKLSQIQPQVSMQLFDNVTNALQVACKDTAKNDRIIVFGSFYTVADAIEFLRV
jgi:dihydrofolate synthase / folylpolyglutamate synthase